MKSNDIINQVISICKMWGYDYMQMDNGVVNYDRLPLGARTPFRYEKHKSLFLQHNRLGHKDLYFYSNSNDDLVAVEAHNVTSKLLSICERIGQFYGFRYQRYEKVPRESDAYYFLF